MTFFIKHSTSITQGSWIVQAIEVVLKANADPDYK